MTNTCLPNKIDMIQTVICARSRKPLPAGRSRLVMYPGHCTSAAAVLSPLRDVTSLTCHYHLLHTSCDCDRPFTIITIVHHVTLTLTLQLKCQVCLQLLVHFSTFLFLFSLFLLVPPKNSETRKQFTFLKTCVFQNRYFCIGSQT